MKEDTSYIHFMDFLDECQGVVPVMYKGYVHVYILNGIHDCTSTDGVAETCDGCKVSLEDVMILLVVQTESCH